jgi:SET and MYND domain-containing protein
MICGSDFDIILSENKGKSLFAKEIILSGSILLSNYPFSSVLTSSHVSQRCSFCFVKAQSLQRCSHCKYVFYCNFSCQKKHWSSHKKECKTIKYIDQYDMENARLTITVLSTLDERTDICISEERNIYNCGSYHIYELFENSEITRSCFVRHQSNRISQYLKNHTENEIASMLSKFTANNFGILDDLMQCIGAGVYPCIALLNHSCLPNCILRYVIKQGSPVCLQVS